MEKALKLTHKGLKQINLSKTLQSIIAGIFILAFILPASVFAGSKISIGSGNWNNPAIWNPSGIPGAGDNVTIANASIITIPADAACQNLTIFSTGQLTLGQNIRIAIGGNIVIDGRMNMNKGMITVGSIGRSFKISSGGTFIWDPAINTSAEATLFTSCVENFATGSNLIIKNWFNYTTPLGDKITGNFGNLEINSPGGNNSIVEWNQNNQFENHRVTGTLTIDQGWITLDKSGSITNTSIGNIVLKNANSIFYGHNGTHASSFNLTTGNITNNGGVFYGLNDGNGNITVQVTGNFFNTGNVKIINNSGIPNVSNGNATLNITGSFTQNTGDTRIVYNIATLNSGTFTSTIGDLNLNGGIFMGQTACHTAGATGNFNVTRNFKINFQNANDKFRGTSLSSISGIQNNLRLKLNVGGDFVVTGIQSAEVTSSASSGNEELSINGNFEINGCTNSFNYGALVASHNTQLNVQGILKMNGGSLSLSKNNGSVSASIDSVRINGGILSVKNNQGTGIIEVIREFNQSGGEFLFHNNQTSVNTENISVAVRGAFIQSGGIINLENNSQNTSSVNSLKFAGSLVSFSGSGKITRSGTGNTNSFGEISYESPRFQAYSRTGTTSSIENIIQKIQPGSKVMVNNCNFLLASNNQSGINMLQVKSNATLALNKGQIISNQQYGFSKLNVDSGGTISTTNPTGFCDQSNRAAIDVTGNLSYELHPYSIIEYTGSENISVTGLAIVSSNESSKYGILKINLQGTNTKASLSGDNVIVRTKLDLQSGALKLNAKTITIENGLPTAIRRTKGYIISEGTTPINNSQVRWQNLTSGSHEIPFGVSENKYIPVQFTVTTGLGKTITVSTRSTNSPNTPYPALDMTFPGGPPFASEHVVDRWWSFTGTGIKANITLTYLGTENTLESGMAVGPLNIIQWTGSGWNITTATATGSKQSTGTIAIENSVLYQDWTIASVEVASIQLNAKLVDDMVSVDWHIQSEQGIDKFIVERSADGINFNQIDEIRASFDNKIRDYTYDDISYTGTESYYRLKQIAPDGSFIYSKVAKVTPKSNSKNLSINSVSPNPFSNEMRINLSSGVSQKTTIQLISSDGKTKFQKDYQSDSGENKIEITNLDALEPGTYILIIESANDRITKKVIKN